MSPKWLTSLVRARQLQEDNAKARLATAQRISHSAHARVRYDADRLDSLVAADAQQSAPAFVAAAVALQAAAATHAAASRAADRADGEVDNQRITLGAAARARRSAEELHEREVSAEQARAARAAQQELDEVAARVHRDGSPS
jgi:flagellar biosynthesis chaperone FliJ